MVAVLESAGDLRFEFPSTDLSLRVGVLRPDSLSGSSYLFLIMELEGAELVPSHYLPVWKLGSGFGFLSIN